MSIIRFNRIVLWTMILAGNLLLACEAHDYWLLNETLTVDSSQDVYKAVNSEEISQDLFVRYQLDYELNNTNSSQSTDVVVSATSYVNGFERATGHKVWHLNASDTVQGSLMTNQLQLGNKLEVSLACCSASKCTNKEVLCLQHDEGISIPDMQTVAEFCYDSCQSTEACEQKCPAESACLKACPENDNACRMLSCGMPDSLDSCDYICNHDEDCMANDCQTANECLSVCKSLSASCFKNCLATWNRCEEEVFSPETDVIPCALCGGEGKCTLHLEVGSVDKQTITSEDGQVYECEIDCRYYPSACVTGCEELYEDKQSRIACLDQCLTQHLFWCNDYNISDDYIDSQGQQPCCFASDCEASLTGVVKSYDVECFNDTSCSSDKVCSPEGICVASGVSSSCHAQPMKSEHHCGLFWLIFISGIVFYRVRQRGTENG